MKRPICMRLMKMQVGFYLFCGPKMKKELASGMGTTVSFSCRSAIGRGRGLRGISGSSSSSSPGQQVNQNVRLFSRQATGKLNYPLFYLENQLEEMDL